jgi:hypothetical protein
MNDTNLLGSCIIAFAILAHAWRRYPRILVIFTIATIVAANVSLILRG